LVRIKTQKNLIKWSDSVKLSFNPLLLFSASTAKGNAERRNAVLVQRHTIQFTFTDCNCTRIFGNHVPAKQTWLTVFLSQNQFLVIFRAVNADVFCTNQGAFTIRWQYILPVPLANTVSAQRLRIKFAHFCQVSPDRRMWSESLNFDRRSDEITRHVSHEFFLLYAEVFLGLFKCL